MRVTRIAGALGARVHGVDLGTADTAVALELGALLAEHQVLVFRDQQLDAQGLERFAAHFGPAQRHGAYGTVPGTTAVAVLESTAERPSRIEVWHADMTFLPEPPLGTVLHAQVVPEHGGDTLFASMTAAWEALSAPLRDLLGGLTAEHSFAHGFRESLAAPGGAERLRGEVEAHPPVVHPVVARHPVTGRCVLYVNRLFTTRIPELAPAESDALLEFLFQHLRREEFTCRFSWAPGSVAFWDNRSTQHKPVNDYFPAHRRMHRVTIRGTAPAA